MRIYAIGDIHGRADLLAELHAAIAADLAGFAGTSTIVYLGDYVDRGSDTRGVLDLLISSTLGTERVFLKGNHEVMLLEFVARPMRFQRWLTAGGLEAAQSYGVSGSDARQVALDLAAAMPEEHLNFLDELQVSHTTDRYFFCHAGVRPGVELKAQDAHDLMWIKGDFLNSDATFEKIVVHGHSPVAEVDIRPNRINVDTRAYASGRLSCVGLEGSGVRVLATRPQVTLGEKLRNWMGVASDR